MYVFIELDIHMELLNFCCHYYQYKRNAVLNLPDNLSIRTHHIGIKTTSHDYTHHTRPSRKSERNLIIIQVNINGIENKPEELKLIIHNTCRYHHNSGNQARPQHNVTTVRIDRSQKAGYAVVYQLP